MEHGERMEKIIGCAYRVATGKLVGLILNFRERKVEIKRKVKDLN